KNALRSKLARPSGSTSRKSTLPNTASAPLSRERSPLHQLKQRICHFRRSDRDADAGGFEGGDFGCCGSFAATHDCAGVAHAAAGWGGGAGDESGDGFLAVFSDPFG